MTADQRPCPGSLQLTMEANAKPAPCPVCRAPVPTLRIGASPGDPRGMTVLAEHRRQDPNALTLELFA